MKTTVKLVGLLRGICLTSMFFSRILVAQVIDQPISVIDISSGSEAIASYQNTAPFDIFLRAESGFLTAISTQAETDYSNSSGATSFTEASILNWGAIDAKMEGDSFFQFVDGIYAQATAELQAIGNVSPRTATATVFAEIENHGAILLEETGSTGIHSSVSANVLAMTTASYPSAARSSSKLVASGKVVNSGDITISRVFRSNVDGVWVEAGISGAGSGMVFFPIRGDEEPDFSGLVIELQTESEVQFDGSIYNAGLLRIDTNGLGYTYGLRTQATVGSTGTSHSSVDADARIINDGDLFLMNAGGGDLAGIKTLLNVGVSGFRTGEIEGVALGGVINSGDIFVESIGGDSAFGIQTSVTARGATREVRTGHLLADASVVNHAVIDVRGHGDVPVIGIETDGMATGALVNEFIGDVYNTGRIRVESLRDEQGVASSDATAIRMNSGGVLYSSGLLSAFSEDALARQVVSGSELTITGYAIEFESGSMAQYQSAIQSDGVVTFKDTVLYVAIPESLESGTFEIPDLVAGTWVGSDGELAGAQFSEVVSQINVPNFDVEILASETGGGQLLKVEYSPTASFANKSMRLSSDVASQLSGRNRDRAMAAIFANDYFNSDETGGFSSQLETAKALGGFHVSPFVLDLKAESGGSGYDADTLGVSFGYDWSVNTNTIIGFDGAYAESEVFFTGDGFDLRNEEVDHYYFGINGAHRISDKFSVFGSINYFETDHRYSDQSPINLESAQYQGMGIESSLDLAYLIAQSVGQQHWVPYFGLSHVWLQRDSFTTENMSSADVHYDEFSASHYFARIGIDWGAQLRGRNWIYAAKVGAQFKRSLQADEYVNNMRVGGSTAEVSELRDRNHYKGYVDLSAEYGSTLLSLGGSIDKADGLDVYGLWFRCSYRY